MLEGLFGRRTGEDFRYVIGKVIHQTGCDGRICAEDIAVVNLSPAPGNLRAVAQPFQVQKTLVVRVSERHLPVHVTAAGHCGAL